METRDTYDMPFIFGRLRQTLVASLATHREARISSRFLNFACTPELQRFYCLTHGGTTKVQELKANADATLTVLTTGEKLDDWSETIVLGRVRILDDFNHPQVREGFRLLAEKSTLVQMMFDSGSLGEYVILALDADELCFRVYADVMRNAPKTILRFPA